MRRLQLAELAAEEARMAEERQALQQRLRQQVGGGGARGREGREGPLERVGGLVIMLFYYV